MSGARVGLGITAALVAAAGLGASAQAAGAASTPFAGFTSQGKPAIAQISGDARQIRVGSVGLDIDCDGGDGDLLRDGFQRLTLSNAGRFGGEFSDLAGTWHDGRATVTSGRLEGRHDAKRRRISGTWRLDTVITGPDGSTVNCTTGTVRFAMHARGAKRSVAGYFGGLTGGGNPIAFQVAANARSLKATVGLFDLECGPERVRFIADAWSKVKLSKKRRFKASVAGHDATFADGTSYKVSSSVSGSIDKAGRVLKGTWRVRMEIPLPEGGTEVCDSGTVRYKLKR